MRRFLAVLLFLCLIVGCFAACDGESDVNGDTTDAVTTGDDTDGKDTDEKETTEKGTDKNDDTETDPTGGEESSEKNDPVVEITPALPEGEADLSYAMGDGYVLNQYNEKAIEDYLAACKYFAETEGYELYSENTVGEAISMTLVKGEGYRVVMYNGAKSELYIGESESGADKLPDKDEELSSFETVTVTQHYSPEINGMCYFVRLEDGSFIVIDGGYKTDMDDAFSTLVRLNGSEYGIHIRAWLVTHSHGDHYEMFDSFSKTYADKVTLDRILYSPLAKVGVTGQDTYLNDRVGLASDRFGAELCTVHTGMVFNYGETKLEILLAPEHIYKSGDTEDFNETSVVFRVSLEDGSMIFLGDCGVFAGDWLVSTYGEALKSDMVQVAHHGCETATAELYDAIAAPTLFWPCNEALFHTYRGEYVKQHIIEAEYSKEHLLHSYGSVTRELSYRPSEIEYINLFPNSAGMVNTSPDADNVRIEDGVLKFDVVGEGEVIDAYISYKVKSVSTEKCNAIKMVVDSADFEGAIYYTAGDDPALRFGNHRVQRLDVSGASDDGKTTIIIYLGDCEDYTRNLSSLRFDFGKEKGQTVEIYSIEGFYVQVD